MRTPKLMRQCTIAAVLVSAPLLQASAQTTSPNPPPATTPAPPPESGPMNRSADPPVVPRSSDKSATEPAKVNPLIGLAVFSSDGNKMGSVQSVTSTPDGKVTAIHIKTGGFLGFGGKMVAIPDAKFTKSGNNIQLGLTADEVSKLPEMKEQS
jgi:hypothetical protein